MGDKKTNRVQFTNETTLELFDWTLATNPDERIHLRGEGGSLEPLPQDGKNRWLHGRVGGKGSQSILDIFECVPRCDHTNFSRGY